MQFIKNHRLTGKSDSVLLSTEDRSIKKTSQTKKKEGEPCGYQHNRGKMLMARTLHLPAHTAVSETST